MMDPASDVQSAISSNGTLRCRTGTAAEAMHMDTTSSAPISPSKRRITEAEIDEIIETLPPWQEQLTIRGLVSGELVQPQSAHMI